jgi:hypothetical protein
MNYLYNIYQSNSYLANGFHAELHVELVENVVKVVTVFLKDEVAHELFAGTNVAFDLVSGHVD